MADAVDLVISSDRSPKPVAPEAGVFVGALKRWVQLHRDAAASAGDEPKYPTGAAKYKTSEAPLREVERENDLLKNGFRFILSPPLTGARARSRLGDS